MVDVGLGDAMSRVLKRPVATFKAASGLSQRVLAGVLSGAMFRIGNRVGIRGQVVEVGQMSNASDLLLAIPR